MEWARIVCANVLRLRKREGLRKNSSAVDAGLDVTYLREIEKGEANPTVKKIAGLAEALGVLPADLFELPK
ncbi:MAG: helix-turn-helix transcriptional regulator [Caulobacteraceae bacterium]|nr:helix-turn-helix transcriptional regulator [Caulobacteraceae bacterium]